jgi:hypothetical protein
MPGVCEGRHGGGAYRVVESICVGLRVVWPEQDLKPGATIADGGSANNAEAASICLSAWYVC